MKLPTLVIALAVAFCLASPLAPLAPLVPPSTRGEVVHSLSLPGVQFHRVNPMPSVSTGKKVEHHMELVRVPDQENTKRHRSATSHLGQVQRDHGGFGYENVTVVNAYAAEYAVEASFNGIPMKVVVDSGSADTWLLGSGFICKDWLNKTQPVAVCSFGPSFPGNVSGKPIPNQHFAIQYGDGEAVSGRMTYLDVEFAGITVEQQEMALATQGIWQGNNVTSGVLGLAYPSLTSAYWGNDLGDHSQYNSAPYEPLFTRMVSDGLIEAVWVIAMDRNSTTGLISMGGMPPVDISASHVATAHLLIANLIGKDITASQPSFYTIVPDGFLFGQSTWTDEYPCVIDTGTTLTYLPKDLADAVNAAFDPPATYMWEYGSYFTACDAIPPQFAVIIGGSDFIINPQDMLNEHAVDTETGLCQTGISSGGSGPFILGMTFLTNVVVAMNIQQATIEFYSREFY